MSIENLIRKSHEIDNLLCLGFIIMFSIFLTPMLYLLVVSTFSFFGIDKTITERELSIIIATTVCLIILSLCRISKKMGELQGIIGSYCSEEILTQAEIEINKDVGTNEYKAELLYYTRQHLGKGNIDRAKELFIRLIGCL